MKIKFYYSNGFCGCDSEEVIDFPDVTNINDAEVIEYGDESYVVYMEGYTDARFIDYPDEEDYESEDEYIEACREAEDEYMEGGEWWCEEYHE